MANRKTASDVLFEAYLSGAALPWDYEPQVPNKTTHPDYRVRFKEQELFFDVKGFAPGAHQPPIGYSTFDPYGPIRTKINEARRQFRPFKEHCCSLVLHNADAVVLVDNPLIVFAAMLGNLGFAVRVSAGVSATNQSITDIFTRGGKMLQGKKKQNTTITAIIVLRQFPLSWRRYQVRRQEMAHDLGRRLTGQEELMLLESCQKEVPSPPISVVIHENPFARHPLRADLFCGPFDERYGWKDGYIVRLHEGSQLRDLRKEAARNGVQDSWVE
jgi:hypothetical protein